MRCNKVAFSYSQLFWKDGKFPKSDCNVVLQICPTSKLCIAIIAHWPQFLSCADLRLWCWIQNQHSSVFCTFLKTRFYFSTNLCTTKMSSMSGPDCLAKDLKK